MWSAADLETSAFICRCNLGNINHLVTTGNFKYFLSIVCSFSCKYFPTCYKHRFIWASLITHVNHNISFTFSIIFLMLTCIQHSSFRRYNIMNPPVWLTGSILGHKLITKNLPSMGFAHSNIILQVFSFLFITSDLLHLKAHFWAIWVQFSIK